MRLLKVGQNYINVEAIAYARAEGDGRVAVGFGERSIVLLEREDAKVFLQWLEENSSGISPSIAAEAGVASYDRW